MIPDDDSQKEFSSTATQRLMPWTLTPNFSHHPFVAPDEAHDPMGNGDTEQDASHNEVMRSKILSTA